MLFNYLNLIISSISVQNLLIKKYLKRLMKLIKRTESRASGGQTTLKWKMSMILISVENSYYFLRSSGCQNQLEIKCWFSGFHFDIESSR